MDGCMMFLLVQRRHHGKENMNFTTTNGNRIKEVILNEIDERMERARNSCKEELACGLRPEFTELNLENVENFTNVIFKQIAFSVVARKLIDLNSQPRSEVLDTDSETRSAIRYMDENLKPRLINSRFSYSDGDYSEIFSCIAHNRSFADSLKKLRTERNRLSAIKKVVQVLQPESHEFTTLDSAINIRNREILNLLECEISDYSSLRRWHSEVMSFFEKHFVRDDNQDYWKDSKAISRVSSRNYKTAWNAFLEIISEEVPLVGRLLSMALALGKLDVNEDTRRKLTSGSSISSDSTTESPAFAQHTVTIRILDLASEEIVRKTWSSATSKVSVAISGPLRKFIESELNDEGRFSGSLEVSTSHFGIESTTLKKFENATSIDVAKWAQNVL